MMYLVIKFVVIRTFHTTQIYLKACYTTIE